MNFFEILHMKMICIFILGKLHFDPNGTIAVTKLGILSIFGTMYSIFLNFTRDFQGRTTLLEYIFHEKSTLW